MRLAEDFRRHGGRFGHRTPASLSSMARRTSSTAWSTSKGLGRYSKAPPWKADTALSRSE
jgi:hypothetical protein